MFKEQETSISYSLENAVRSHQEILQEFKLNTIFDYAKDLTKEETEKIKKYVQENIEKEIQNYQVLKIKNQIIGCFCIKSYEDGILLDEIYLLEPYRDKKIGSTLIKKILKENKIVYLWVYKENVIALNLYKKLGFKIQEETETRYFMRYKK